MEKTNEELLKEKQNAEEEAKRKLETERTASLSNTGDKPKGLSTLERADAIAERTEKAAERIEAANKVAEELEVRRALGGQTQAGQTPVVETPKEETPQDYVKKVAAGEIQFKD